MGVNKYRKDDLITFEDDEQVLCLSTCLYNGNEYLLVSDYVDNQPIKPVFVLKSIEEEMALGRLTDKRLELRLLRYFRSKLSSE